MPPTAPIQEVEQLRSMGLTDALIFDELSKKGFSPSQVTLALAQLNTTPKDQSSSPGYQSRSPPSPLPLSSPSPNYNFMPPPPGGRAQGGTTMALGQDAMYSRFEEIAENIIDSKWDELITEVKKIIEWKQQIEERLSKAESELSHLKDDFKTLHQGILGKLDEYDTRMRDVGVDLKAVGKVFKDVVPQFVDNVKELSAISRDFKSKK